MMAVLLLWGCATSAVIPLTAESPDPFPDDRYHERAAAIELGVWHADKVGPSATDSQDWKTFTLRQPTRLRLNFINSAPAGDVLLKIFREDGYPMMTVLGTAGSEQLATGDFQAGTFLVEISVESIEFGLPYMLKLQSL